jgi:hypothetical protein
MPAKKNVNGEGSVYQRADGRWCGAAHVVAADGTSLRIHVYGASHREASDKLAAKIADSMQGAGRRSRSASVFSPGSGASESATVIPLSAATSSRPVGAGPAWSVSCCSSFWP